MSTHNHEDSAEDKHGQDVAVEPTSRLIVRPLPKGADDSKLKQYFESQGGLVTDARVMKKPDGKSRFFGFVGFKTVEDATQALKYFDKSYFGTTRIFVSYARPRGDSLLPRPWSKYSKGSSEYEREQKKLAEASASSTATSKKRKATSLPEDSTDAGLPDMKKKKFEEFLGLTDKSTKSWENDGGFGFDKLNQLPAPEGPSKKKNPKKDNKKNANKENKTGFTSINSDSEEENDTPEQIAQRRAILKAQGEDSDSDDEYQTLPIFQKKKSKKSDKMDDDDSDSESSEISDSESISSSSDASDDSESDSDDSESGSSSDTNSEKDGAKETSEKSSEKPSNTLNTLDSGRLYVRNLSFNTTEEDLKKLFSKYGAVSDVHISFDKLAKRSKGFCFVSFEFPGHAVEAMNALDGKPFQGRLLHIMPAQTKEKHPSEVKQVNGEIAAASTSTSGVSAGDDAPTNPEEDLTVPKPKNTTPFFSEYQKKRLEKQRALANQDFNWNSLFMRPDAVAGAMATTLSVDKSAILDRESTESMAVRLALGETRIIQETKDFLVAQGVSLDALKGHFSREIERSTTLLLAKNIPTSTQVDELRSIFGKFGTLTRVVMPPSRTIALIEFAVANEAKSAFRSLAYKQFKDAPLLLEWAPVGIFTTPAPSDEQSTTLNKKAEDEEKEVVEDAGSSVEKTSKTLYIKNLHFSTTEESLRKYVEDLFGEAAISHVSVAKHSVNDKMVSQGYGFVEFTKRDHALRAWKRMQNTVLDGHQLDIQFTKITQSAAVSAEAKRLATKRKISDATANESTKIMVKNVPFQANRKELRDLFAPFGELRALRLPKKPGGKGHVGYAFVEYVTPEEAVAAMEALGSTHLYGRRLVLGFANEDDNVEAIRRKTAALYEDNNQDEE